MNVNGNYSGGIERPSPLRLTATTITDAYESDSNSVVIASISLANETSSSVDVELYYNDGTTDFLFHRESVAGSGGVQVTDAPLRLYESDKLRVKAATANAITITPIVIRSHPNEQTSL